MRAPVFALFFGGCSFSASSPAGAPSDAAIDSAPPIIDSAPLDGSLPPVCAGTYVRICADPPQQMVTLTQNINTTDSSLCAAYGSIPSTPNACVITGQSITIPSGVKVSVTGNRQLILFSTGGITISGTLDAAGHGRTSGPSDGKAPCGQGATNPTRGSVGGGGWGGSFGGTGGNGGNGVDGIGGVAAAATGATALRSGCPGSDGANSGTGRGAGSHGAGGGAVLLIANQTILIDGTLDASGGGGGGGTFGGGGGGGGSGGMIVLDAATVNTLGKCFANGGGGGEGGNVATGRSGGESTAPDVVGSGGQGGASTGGDGGDSGFGTTPDGSAGKAGTSANFQKGGNGGGGGGGGGVGVIKVFSDNQQNTTDPKKVAPPPAPNG